MPVGYHAVAHLLAPEPHKMQEQGQLLESLIKVIAEEFFSMSEEEQASYQQPNAPPGAFVPEDHAA